MTRLLQTYDMTEHIRQSNLIEDIEDHSEDIQSIIAWRFLREKNRLDLDVLLELHNLITKNQLPAEDSGRFRRTGVQVGGYICPEPYLAQQLVHNWIYAMQTFWPSLDPIDMHIRFEKIHPFVDGNGRTGRMLMWWHEMKQDEKPTIFTVEERQKYYDLFKKETE